MPQRVKEHHERVLTKSLVGATWLSTIIVDLLVRNYRT
jgi:hypothetical protein